VTTSAINTAKSLVDSLAERLPADRLKQFGSFIAVGELEELAYGLIGTLRQYGIAVTPAEHDLLRDLLYSFDLPIPSYPLLSNRDQYLAELTVHDGPASAG
jgi:hypothetical protein